MRDGWGESDGRGRLQDAGGRVRVIWEAQGWTRESGGGGGRFGGLADNYQCCWSLQSSAGRQAGTGTWALAWALGHLWVVKGSLSLKAQGLKGSAGFRGSWLVNLGDWRSSQRRAGARTDCRRALAGSSAKTQLPCTDALPRISPPLWACARLTPQLSIRVTGFARAAIRLTTLASDGASPEQSQA